MRFPHMVQITQELYCAPLTDVAGTVRRQLDKINLATQLKPGMKIAVTAGSRGIAGLPEVLRATVAYLQEHDTKPFVIPAMGSHGGATAEGQVAMLKSIGVTEESIGAPIHSNMKAVLLGETVSGIPIYMDPNAAKADGIIAINRIKEHTDFADDIESGLLKVLSVGLGKDVGAKALHARGIERMGKSVIEVARAVIDNKPVFCGIALMEDSYQNIALVEALPPEKIEAGERRLLKRMKGHAARLPFEQIDVLIIDRIGKEISGTGMDPNVTGRYATKVNRPGRQTDCHTIVVLGLTEASKGNATGIGTADLIPSRVLEQMDVQATYTNVLTSGNFAFARIPVVSPTDRTAVIAALTSGLAKSAAEIRVVRIKDTLHIGTLAISEGLLAEAEANPKLKVASKLSPMKFDEEGTLI